MFLHVKEIKETNVYVLVGCGVILVSRVKRERFQKEAGYKSSARTKDVKFIYHFAGTTRSLRDFFCLLSVNLSAVEVGIWSNIWCDLSSFNNNLTKPSFN